MPVGPMAELLALVASAVFALRGETSPGTVEHVIPSGSGCSRASLRNRLMKCRCVVASFALQSFVLALRRRFETIFCSILASPFHAWCSTSHLCEEKKEPAPQLRDAACVPPLRGPRPTPSRRLFPAALSFGEITLAVRGCPTWCRILPFIIVVISPPQFLFAGFFFFLYAGPPLL